MTTKEEKFIAVSHIPSALYVTCAKDNKSGKIDGFLASWVQQVSFEPLLISICIKSERLSFDSIKEGEVFSMNIVGEHNKQIMKPFWSGYPEGQSPFDELEHSISEEGGIVLKDAKSTLICKAREITSPGDHNLVVAEVLNTIVSNPESETVVHKRRTAFDY